MNTDKPSTVVIGGEPFRMTPIGEPWQADDSQAVAALAQAVFEHAPRLAWMIIALWQEKTKGLFEEVKP
jgi:hypothetical protein